MNTYNVVAVDDDGFLLVTADGASVSERWEGVIAAKESHTPWIWSLWMDAKLRQDRALF